MIFKNLFYKKKHTEKLVWDYNISNINADFSIDDFFVKASDNLPGWFAKLKPPVLGKDSITDVLTARTCPSFLEVFKNSLLFRSPCDLEIEYSRDGFRCNIHPDSAVLLEISSHTSMGSESQMGPHWDKGIHNIKLSPRIMWKPTYDTLKAVVLPSYYWNQASFMQPAPGVVEMIPDHTVGLEMNFFIDSNHLKGSSSKLEVIRHGDPLALLYFPGGLPKIEKGSLKRNVRRRLIGDWSYKLRNYEKNKQTKKCPF